MIEAIRFQGRKVEVDVSGETFVLHENIYFELSPEVGQEIDLSDAVFRSRVQFAFDKATDYLISRQKSAKQVKDYLIQKDFSSDVADEAVAKLEDMNLIDDDEYARVYIESFHGERGQRYLEQKLWERGIKSADLPEEDPEIVCGILEKRWGKSGISEQKDRLKAQNFLLSRGFSYDTIRKALELYNNLESKR